MKRRRETPQKITFPPIPNQTVATKTYLLQATSTSGLPVTYKVSGPATVTGNKLTLLGPGAVKVAAYCPGNANYTTAPEVQQAFKVTR